MPAGFLLTHEHDVDPRTVHSFRRRSRADIDAFLQRLDLRDDDLAEVIDALKLPVEQRVRNRLDLVYALHCGWVIAIRTRPASAASPEVEPIPEPAEGPGYRKPTLGPHEGLHNQAWDSVTVKPDSFKTVRKVDMGNLSAEDKYAAKALERQGWKDKEITKVLNSGDNFTAKELQPGDKLHAFGTEGREKNIQTSAYWLDDAGFKDVQSKYYRDGQWDKEGVKNYLALPCFNRATDISTVQVTQHTTVVESRIVKARELIQYTEGSGYTTGMIGKIMPGGGKQITANPAVLANI